MKKKYHFNQVVFAAHIKKINKFNKNTDRALLVTDRSIFKLDPKKSYKPMTSGISLTKIQGLSVSSESDQLVIIHIDGADDLVVCVDKLNRNVTSEAVARISHLVKTQLQREVPVTVSSNFNCTLGGKTKSLTVRADSSSTPNFRKTSATSICLSATPI